MLAKKAEGRSLSPEEYQVMGVFMDRVERRTIEVQEEADRVEQEKITEIRAGISPAAFELELAEVETLKEHIFNILFEAEYETVGDLMLALQLDSDKVFDLPGIGPEAIENITEVLAGMEFPEPGAEVEPEPEPEEVAVVEEVKEKDEQESEKEEIAEEVVSETDEVATAEADSDREEEERKAEEEKRISDIRANIAPAAFGMALDDTDLEERVLSMLKGAGYKDVGNLMFSLQLDPSKVFDLPGFGIKAIENMTEVLATLTFPEEKEEDLPFLDDDGLDLEDKKKQRKKYVKYEYDPELGEVVAQKRRKRAEDEWDDEADW
jgi:N utilization substance protein A